MGCKLDVRQRKAISIGILICLIVGLFINVNAPTIFNRQFIMPVHADPNCANNSSSWHNSSYLNVSILAFEPRVIWYDFQKCTSYTSATTSPPNIDTQTWSSRRNCMTEVDNETWYRFIINISSDQGWDDIEYINISGWHDNGSDSDVNGSLAGTGGYNRSGNMGANRNFFMYYENISGTAYFNLTYPSNGTEITIGGFSERNVNDAAGVTGETETKNISFVFKPGFQFRYAHGPGESAAWTNNSITVTNGNPSGPGYNATTHCWQSNNNSWSWNFNITVEDSGEDGPADSYKSWAMDEFGVYSYTEIISPVSDVSLVGTPGENVSTDSSSNVTIKTVSNGNYSLTINISDLIHIADSSETLSNETIWIRGGILTSVTNFSHIGRKYIFLYGEGSGDGNTVNTWENHEVNGTYKTTDQSDGTYPNGYGSGNYNSLNPDSHNIEFSCDIPLIGQLTGTYSSHIYYHLRTQTHN